MVTADVILRSAIVIFLALVYETIWVIEEGEGTGFKQRPACWRSFGAFVIRLLFLYSSCGQILQFDATNR